MNNDPNVHRKPEVEERVLDLLEEGKSLRAAAKIVGYDEKQIRRWVRFFPDFAERYRNARDLALDMMADEVIDFADSCPADKGAVAAARLRFDARRWYLCKLAPKRYGDKLDLNHGAGDKPVKMVIGWETES